MDEPAPGGFPPTRAAALDRLAAVRPAEYARTRNHLRGAVSRLSPYITHGLLTLPEVYRAVDDRHRIGAQHKFSYELGWREFFHHQWLQHGGAIFESLRPGPLPDSAYARAMPDDVLHACTGIAVIDQAVTELHQTGWLHNHARMWLASYLVHLRRVHWRVGADWMYGHLLDGDLASNHLSWQWVAGTASHKPYLFNADNVARYAPPHWHSPGTIIDTDYESLEAIARGGPLPDSGGRRSDRIGATWVAAAAAGAGAGRGEAGDGLVAAEGLQSLATSVQVGPSTGRGPAVSHEPPRWLPGLPTIERAALSELAGHWLVHPWNIRPAPGGRRAIGVLLAPFHERWPWSEQRWQFVLAAMGEVCERIVWCERLEDEAGGPAGFDTIADPHLVPWLPPGIGSPVPRLFDWPQRACRSFSDFWNRTRLARA